MYTTITLFIFIAFLFFYNTSKKNKWPDKPAWAKYFETRKSLSLFISAILLLVACIILVCLNGTVAGIFSFIVVLMAMGCLIVLLFPFRYLSVVHVILLFCLFVVFEQFIF